MKAALSYLSGVIFCLAFVPYVRAIVRKETKPSKSTWIIWATLDTITLAGMYFKDSVNGQIVGAVIGSWVVVVLALKYGVSGWTKLDKLCLGSAVLGVVLWRVFSSPMLGILTSLSVVFLGSTPTFESAWKDPSREDKLAWVAFWISCVLAVIAIPQWTLADAAQPITFFAIETIMMYILFVRPKLAAVRTEKA